MEPSELAALEALRRSHCARSDGEHACVGELVVDAKGARLNCAACGSDSFSALTGVRSEALDRARAIAQAIGIDWQALCPERQRRVVDELLRDHCPRCGSRRDPGRDYWSCSRDDAGCQMRWSAYGGWRDRGGPAS